MLCYEYYDNNNQAQIQDFSQGGGEIFKEQNFFQELGTKFKKKGTKLT